MDDFIFGFFLGLFIALATWTYIAPYHQLWLPLSLLVIVTTILITLGYMQK